MLTAGGRSEAEIACLQNVAGGDDHPALEHIAQLADIAGPAVRHQQVHGLARNALDVAARANAELLEKMLDQKRDVFRRSRRGGSRMRMTLSR